MKDKCSTASVGNGKRCALLKENLKLQIVYAKLISLCARSIALYMSHIEHVWIKSLEFVGVITINLIGSFLCRLQIRYSILYGPQCTTALCLFINEFNNCVQTLTLTP